MLNPLKKETTMKALKKILGLLPVAAALMLTACSSDDNMTENTQTPEEPKAETKGIPFTVTVSTGGDATTRAELANDNDPSATTTYLQALNFESGDRLYITSAKGHGVLTLKDGVGTNTATFEGTLSETPDADTELTATLVSQVQFSSIGESYAYVTVDANDAVTVNYRTGIVVASYQEAIRKFSKLTGTALYGTGAPQFTLAQKSVFLHMEITCNCGTYPDGTSTGYLTLNNNGAVLGERTTVTVSSKASDGYNHLYSCNFITDVDNLASLSNATLTIEAGGITAIKTIKDVATIQAKFYNINRDIVNVGDVIADDGKIYSTKDAVIAAGATRRAMVAYIGDAKAGGTGDATCAHGLAIALEDVKNGNDAYLTWSELEGYFTTWASSKAVTGISATATTGWRIPTADDWKYMFQGCGGQTYIAAFNTDPYSYGDIKTMVTTAGGSQLISSSLSYYWSSTDYSGDKRCYYFYGTKFVKNPTNQEAYTRPVLAF